MTALIPVIDFQTEGTWRAQAGSALLGKERELQAWDVAGSRGEAV